MDNYFKTYGAVHKVRHAILANFYPLPLSHFVTHPGTPPKVRHTSRTTPPIFRRPSTKNPDKSPLVQILSQLHPGILSGDLLSGRFCPGWFLSISVLSEYICYIRKLNITLNFMFRMCGNFFYKCDVI